MNKIGNTFQHINEEEDISTFEPAELYDDIVTSTFCALHGIHQIVHIFDSEHFRFLYFSQDFGDPEELIALDDIELIQKRALSLTSMIGLELEGSINIMI